VEREGTISSVSFREVICEGRDLAWLFAMVSPKFDSRRRMVAERAGEIDHGCQKAHPSSCFAELSAGSSASNDTMAVSPKSAVKRS
jgi:hypothetical protein